MARLTPHIVHHVVKGIVRPGVREHSVAWFLGALVALFMIAPYIETMPNGAIVQSVLFTVVLSSAVLAVGSRKWVLVVALVLVVPTLAARWLNHVVPTVVVPEVFMVGGLLFSAFVSAHLLVFVLRAPRVSSEVLCAGVATYLMLGLIFTFMYLVVGQLDPHAFTCTLSAGPDNTMHGFNVLYYSLVSMNGAAFGDFMPVSGTARMLGMVQTTVGLFYMALMISRLVSLYAPAKPQPLE